MVGSITTVNQAGGPIPLTDAITFTGGIGVTLVPTTDAITWNVMTGPTPRQPASASGAVGNTQIVWSATAPAGGQAPAGYLFQFATNPTFTSGVVTTDLGAGLTHTTTGLTNGVTYYGRFAAYYNGAIGSWTDAASAAPSPYALFDDFSSGSAVPASIITVGSSAPQTWSASVNDAGSAAGTWPISGGTCVPTGGSAWIAVFVDSLKSDCTITLASSVGKNVAIVFRWASAGNFWRAALDNNGHLQLVKVTAGTGALISSNLTTTAGPTTIQIILSGSSITFSANGGSCGATDVFDQTATVHGMGGDPSSGAVGTLDNFTVQ